MSCQASAQLANDTARAEPAGSLKAKGTESARGDDGDQYPKIAADRTELLAAGKCSGDNSPQQHSLRNHQQRCRNAQHDGADERHAR